MTATSETSGVKLTIDLDAIVRNWTRLHAFAPGAEVSAVVKADAYGLGLDHVVPALAAAGCHTFFVATLDEGLRVRLLAHDVRVFVLSGLTAENAKFHVQHGLTPVLNTIEDIHTWRVVAAALGRSLVAALHVNTGMNRLGINLAEAEHAIGEELLTGLMKLELLMSHLACADNPSHPMTAQQRASFEQFRALFERPEFGQLPASLANSAGILQDADLAYQLVRPGIALYGGEAIDGTTGPMENVVTAQARIVQIRNVEQGEVIGYGAAHEFDQSSRIAIAAIGYGDGYHRSGSGAGIPMRQKDRAGGAVGYIAGREVPLIGRISMDLSAFDVSSLPDGMVRQGDWVEVFGDNIDLDDVARSAGTIGYEILTSLSRRADRQYVHDNKVL